MKNSSPSNLRSRLAIISIVCVAMCSITPRAWATARNWTGGGANNNWSTTANWSPAGSLAQGDDLTFPGGLGVATTNNFSGLRLNSISFSGAAGGYTLRGNPITLTSGINAGNTAGNNIIDLTITNGAAQTFTATTGGTLDFNGDIAFNGFNLTLNNSVAVGIGGVISGTGNLTKNGSGNLLLHGAVNNTYTGSTTVNAGTLELNDSSGATAMVPGDIILNNSSILLLSEGNQIADTADVTINGTAVLSLGSFSETIASLTFGGSGSVTGTGTLTNGNITLSAASITPSISANLYLGGSTRTYTVSASSTLTISGSVGGGNSGLPLFTAAGITKVGTGTLTLSGANTYGGITTINDGQLSADNNLALGVSGPVAFLSNPTTIVNSNAVLLLVGGTHITNEVLTLNSTNPSGALQDNGACTWAGDIYLDTDVVIETSSAMVIDGQITGPGGFTKISTSTLTLRGTTNNQYAGTTTVNAGTLLLDVNYVNGAIPADLVIGNGGADVVRLLRVNQIANTANVTLNTGAALDLGGFNDSVSTVIMTAATVSNGTFTVSGSSITVNASSAVSTISSTLRLFASTVTIDVADGAAFPDLLISGVVNDNAMIKNGNGTLELDGANTYSGLTTINAGTVIVEDDSALGGTANGTTVNSGAAVLLGFGVSTLPEVLTLNGTGMGGTGALIGTGVATVGTNVIFGSATTINSFTNGGGVAALTINGTISGTGPLTKIGIGTLSLAGSANNTFSGGVTVNEGVLALSKDATRFALTSGTLIIGDGIGGADADVVRYITACEINSAMAIIINSSGLLDLNGFNDDVGSITLNGGGDIQTGAGTLTMGGNVTIHGDPVANTSSISGILDLNGATRTFNVDDGNTLFLYDLSVSARVVGTGAITKTGTGGMSLSSSNAYTGVTTVNQGALGALDSFALGATAGGTVVNNNATLRLQSGIAVGAEALTLNTTGTDGSPAAALYAISGYNSWRGDITLSSTAVIDVDTADTLMLSGVISGTGGLTKNGAGTNILTGPPGMNTYSGTTTVNAGVLRLSKTGGGAITSSNLIIGDGVGGANADVVAWDSEYQVNTACAVTINSSGLLSNPNYDEQIGSLSGSGNIDLGTAGDLTFGDASDTTFSGAISGAQGQFVKQGIGTVTFTGNSTFGNAVGGVSQIIAGKLVVNGSILGAPLRIGATGILGGSGTVSDIINTLGGVVAPGTSPAILTSSNILFSGVASDFTVELAGLSPGTGYDRLNVRGTNSLGGATLNVTASFGLSNAPSIGTQFTILLNNGSDAITGTFAGLPNNGAVNVDSLNFRINYDGGSGNDVVLTLTNAAAASAGVSVGSGNGNGLVDPNECNTLNIVVSNRTAAAMTGIIASLSSLTPGVSVVQVASAYPDIPASSSRTNSSVFQISTAPTFQCGQNIQLELALQTATHNSFKIPVTVPTGAAGVVQAFNNNSATAIPDGGPLNSTVVVSNITAPVFNVAVTLHLTHPQDQDLDITLESPDGTVVELTTDNGGSSANYGTGCAARTTFDDGGDTAITAGTAPFVGAIFRPEGKLTDFRGKFGTNVNGTWTLHVADDNLNGFSGTLQCWGINLVPASCAAGGGICELCPDVTIHSAIGGTNSLQANYATFNGVPSTCGAPKVCPGTTVLSGLPSENLTFQNGPSDACVTITMENSSAISMLAAVYSGSFNPANPDKCVNYLADCGNIISSGNPSQAFSFNVASNAIFVINVIASVGAPPTPYKLTVSGGDCRPVLNIAPAAASQVKFDWTTAAPGYQLERTNVLGGASTNWLPVTNIPVVVSSHFTVTNTVATGTNNFFRLRKP